VSCAGGGVASLKFSELADRTGLARPSVYEYFKTKGDLVVALVEEVSCLSRNVTVPSPCYTHGEEPVDVEAYPS
jgi:Bacterial regulatory proteins, tetR family